MANQGPMTVNPHLFKNVKIDPLTAFDPVTLIAEAPLVVVVPEGSRFASFQALIDEAKANPGGLTYGSAGNGSASHLATLLLANTAGARHGARALQGRRPRDHRPDRRPARLHDHHPALGRRLHRQRQGQAAGGDHAGARPSGCPRCATIAESGYPTTRPPPGTASRCPRARRRRSSTKLRDATVAATKTADVQKSLDIEGAVVIGSTPEEFGAFMQGESKRWAELIAKTGLTTD